MKSILLAALILAASAPPFASLAQPAPARPRRIVIPRDWGEFKAVYHDQLVFEDKLGTLRLIYPSTGDLVFTLERR